MLPRLQRRGHSLNVAEVVGPKGVVVTSAERYRIPVQSGVLALISFATPRALCVWSKLTDYFASATLAKLHELERRWGIRKICTISYDICTLVYGIFTVSLR